MTTLTRLYRFAASHRLHLPELTSAENADLFGKCNNPFGHGHDYVLSVTVRGDVDETTGLMVPLQKLDRFVERTVLAAFSSKNMNTDVPQFRDVVPTTENVALVIVDLLEEEWPSAFGDEGAVRLHRIHVQETDRNGFEVLLPVRKPRLAVLSNDESVKIHV